ncbi:MAG TPA: dihydroorotate dehydrogenase-like protein [Prolixibacteraceae bacterium]|nr:dihydroorotate dehydrogenase-like protein [Prolixibacteraceae bacterium]
MANLNTNYMGLSLKNPIIAGSSGLTNSVKMIKQLEEAGVGAVVLKSLFEEQIRLNVSDMITSSEQNYSYPEAEDYIRNYTKMNTVQQYLEFVKEVKAAVSIPVIASINCITASDWTDFAAEIENAGADALELNIYEMPVDKNISSESYEKKYFDILRMVKRKVKIPIAIKIGDTFTNLLRFVDQLHAHGASSVVLFNKFYTPDFDLQNLSFDSAEVMSSPSDLNRGLRWTGIIKGKLPRVQIAASTGVHNGEGAIKQILAGAQVVQLCSTLYINGVNVVEQILNDIEAFMTKKDFESIDQFRAMLSYGNIANPSLYERSQFLKYFSNRK